MDPISKLKLQRASLGSIEIVCLIKDEPDSIFQMFTFFKRSQKWVVKFVFFSDLLTILESALAPKRIELENCGWRHSKAKRIFFPELIWF